MSQASKVKKKKKKGTHTHMKKGKLDEDQSRNAENFRQFL